MFTSPWASRAEQEETTGPKGMPEHIFLQFPWESNDSKVLDSLEGKKQERVGGSMGHVYQSQQLIWARIQVVCLSKFDEI